MSSYSDLASISSAIENLELGDTFHDQDEEISVEDPSIGAEREYQRRFICTPSFSIQVFVQYCC